jgi:uncharacterized protein YecE (DUF72 family)
MVKTQHQDLKSAKIMIGTSGWYYQHWQGVFYPEALPKSDWLKYYTEHFATVEVNNTFYHLPKDSSLENWYKLSPEDFIFTIKASRYITHIKKLKDISQSLQLFINKVHILGEKLGPVLYQLPPSMNLDVGLLENFIKQLPAKHISVFEFRNESWYCDEVLQLLKDNNISFCIHDLVGLASPKVITAKTIYIRFHGPGQRYGGNYTTKQLTDWTRWIDQSAVNAKYVFAYFNNDIHGYAIANALQLQKLLGFKK